MKSSAVGRVIRWGRGRRGERQTDRRTDGRGLSWRRLVTKPPVHGGWPCIQYRRRGVLGPCRIASDAQSSLAQNFRPKWNVVRVCFGKVKGSRVSLTGRCRCRFVAKMGVLLAARFPPKSNPPFFLPLARFVCDHSLLY